MACYHPQRGYRRSKDGKVTVGFEPSGSNEKLLLPCGKCIGCKLEYAQMWSVRCRHEAQLWEHNAFVTLTYDDESLPWDGSLSPRDLSLFLKRLRKNFEGDKVAPDGRKPIRYFAAGEYGSQTRRPHYHLLLFNVRLRRGRQVTDTTWESPDLSGLWKYGAHAVGGVDPASAAYVAQYSVKKMDGKFLPAIRGYETVLNLLPEFCLMSRNPGLGHWWFEKYSSDLERGYVVIDGAKVRIPRFYKSRLEADPDIAYGLECAREEHIAQLDPKEISADRLGVRETVAKSRRRTFETGREAV